MPKIIAHIDIDTFFVSSEIRLDSKLEGQPIAISRRDDFAMAVSVSKEVKEKGFKITDKIVEIKKKIPNLIVIRPNMNYYKFLSNQFFTFISKNFTKKIEVYSIDECFLDLTDFSRNFKTLSEMLHFIKDELQKNLKLPISIGVSYNKLLAKMATNLAKHSKGRIVLIPEFKIPSLIHPQKIENLFGIGAQNSKKLKDAGIFTIGDFVKKGINDEKIVQILGVNRHYFFQSLTGKGDNNVSNRLEKFKSISHFRTFPLNNLLTKREILNLISNFLSEIVEKLKKYSKAANRVEIFFKLKNKVQNRFFTNLTFPSNDYDFLYENLVALVEKINDFSFIFGFGIAVSKISDYDTGMLKTNPKVKSIISDINKKMGSKKLFVLNHIKN